MKTTFLLVAILGIAVRGGKTQDMEESQVDLISDIVHSVRALVDDGQYIPIDKSRIVDVIARNFPDIDMTFFCSKMYGKFCATTDCDKYAYPCAKTFFIEGKTSILLSCAIETKRRFMGDGMMDEDMMVEAMMMGEDMLNLTVVKAAFDDCVLPKAMDKLNLSDEMTDDYQQNFKRIFEVLLDANEYLTDSTKSLMKEDLGDSCSIPEKGSCFSEIMTLEKCLMHTCVKEMWKSDPSRGQYQELMK